MQAHFVKRINTSIYVFLPEGELHDAFVAYYAAVTWYDLQVAGGHQRITTVREYCGQGGPTSSDGLLPTECEDK